MLYVPAPRPETPTCGFFLKIFDDVLFGTASADKRPRWLGRNQPQHQNYKNGIPHVGCRSRCFSPFISKIKIVRFLLIMKGRTIFELSNTRVSDAFMTMSWSDVAYLRVRFTTQPLYGTVAVSS